MENNTKLIIMAIFGLVVIILAWYVLFELGPQGPQPQPYVTNITIINSNGTNVNGVYIINGSVQNKNPFNITVVDINASGFSSNGSVVNTGAGFTLSSPIAAGGTSNFTLSLYDPQNLITTYTIHVEDASK